MATPARSALPIVWLLTAVALLGAAQQRPSTSITPGKTSQQAPPAFENSVLIQPAQLARELKEPKGKRPVVLHVGFDNLYQGSHIPGSIHAGPCSKAQGLEDLRGAAAGIPRSSEVVIYCGCCPMKKCPNIHPAYDALKKMGFERVKVLDIAQTFVKNWEQEGMPVEKGTKP